MSTRKLAANVYVGEVFYPAGSTPPKDVADQITNPKAWGDTDAGDTDQTGSYGDMKAADLKAKIEKRNESRSDDAKLPVSGSKADLIAVLEADDSAAA